MTFGSVERAELGSRQLTFHWLKSRLDWDEFGFGPLGWAELTLGYKLGSLSAGLSKLTLGLVDLLLDQVGWRSLSRRLKSTWEVIGSIAFVFFSFFFLGPILGDRVFVKCRKNPTSDSALMIHSFTVDSGLVLNGPSSKDRNYQEFKFHLFFGPKIDQPTKNKRIPGKFDYVTPYPFRRRCFFFKKFFRPGASLHRTAEISLRFGE